jgi:hypothetical protein
MRTSGHIHLGKEAGGAPSSRPDRLPAPAKPACLGQGRGPAQAVAVQYRTGTVRTQGDRTAHSAPAVAYLNIALQPVPGRGGTVLYPLASAGHDHPVPYVLIRCTRCQTPTMVVQPCT